MDFESSKSVTPWVDMASFVSIVCYFKNIHALSVDGVEFLGNSDNCGADIYII